MNIVYLDIFWNKDLTVGETSNFISFGDNIKELIEYVSTVDDHFKQMVGDISKKNIPLLDLNDPDTFRLFFLLDGHHEIQIIKNTSIEVSSFIIDTDCDIENAPVSESRKYVYDKIREACVPFLRELNIKQILD